MSRNRIRNSILANLRRNAQQSKGQQKPAADQKRPRTVTLYV